MEIEVIREIKDISLDKKHRFYYVAKYIVDNISNIPDISITELAKNTYSSASTINRFTKYLNLSGYKELIHIIKYFNYTVVENDKLVKDSNNVISHIYEDYIQSVKDTFALFLVQEEKVDEFVSQLKKASRINVFAFGTTYNAVAKNFQEMLLRLGFNAFSSNSFHKSHFLVKQSREDTVNVFISYSGEIEELTKLAKICKENKSQTISVSKKSNNALSRVVDLNLSMNSLDPIDGLFSITNRLVLAFYLNMIIYKIIFSDLPYYESLVDKSFIKKI